MKRCGVNFFQYIRLLCLLALSPTMLPLLRNRSIDCRKKVIDCFLYNENNGRLRVKLTEFSKGKQLFIGILKSRCFQIVDKIRMEAT